MKKLSKNFRQMATVEAMAKVCTDGCYYCSCGSSYCQCVTTADYAGYQSLPSKTAETNTLYTNRFNFLVQYDGIV